MHNSICNNFGWFVLGLAAGAGAMYFLDPQGGRRRRAIARDKAMSWANDAADFADKKARHLRNQGQGLMHEARSAVGATAG
jgi:hypothetical protein